jgi:hypothetical protein
MWKEIIDMIPKLNNSVLAFVGLISMSKTVFIAILNFIKFVFIKYSPYKVKIWFMCRDVIKHKGLNVVKHHICGGNHIRLSRNCEIKIEKEDFIIDEYIFYWCYSCREEFCVDSGYFLYLYEKKWYIKHKK